MLTDAAESGELTEAELRTALVNGDWTPFDPHTVRMMIRMFDTNRSGSVNFDEFCGLWGFLSAWRSLFDRFDQDHSGSISYAEFNEALIAFGYRLSQQFVTLLYRTYDRDGRNALSFDLFVQACISLKRMTDVFKKYDEDRDARSFSQVRKLYSSSTPFRPPLIPDSTRNHPPAMSSRNTSTRFAQHLDTLPNRGPPSIIPSLQRRTDCLYRPLISDLARRCMMENMIWCSNSARTCVVLVGNQARLMKRGTSTCLSYVKKSGYYGVSGLVVKVVVSQL
ncbi:hypothetical protein IG631_15181 [Alternaria alternata]|nr:hypothetical protein IG631_15181 [Alternaria alternata]